MELVRGGELLDRIINKEHYTELEAAKCFMQIMDAIQYLHSQGIVHRDIKAQNLLVSASLDDLRVIDFNTARRLEEGGSLTMTGTHEWSAPEVLLGSSPSDCSDIWGTGLCLYFMLQGKLPYRMCAYSSADCFAQAVAKAAGCDPSEVHECLDRNSQWQEA